MTYNNEVVRQRVQLPASLVTEPREAPPRVDIGSSKFMLKFACMAEKQASFCAVPPGVPKEKIASAWVHGIKLEESANKRKKWHRHEQLQCQ